ncbi:MAG: fibronectin type III domain-containing protein, partial [Acidobacteriota bacterium]
MRKAGSGVQRIAKEQRHRSNLNELKEERRKLKTTHLLSDEEAQFLELEDNSATPTGGSSQLSMPPSSTSTAPADGVNREYAIILNGGPEQRFWDDVRYAYEFFRNTREILDSDIYVLQAYGKAPDNTNPDNIIDYAANDANFQTVCSTVATRADADDVVYLIITDHGYGYSGPVQRASSQAVVIGYLDGTASIDSGDEPDYLETDFKLRAFITGGDYRRRHGMEVLTTYKAYKSATETYFYRHKYVSRFQNVTFATLGTISDNDIYIEEIKDYLQGDLNKDGIINTATGEKADNDGDGISPYNNATGTYDEDDWGLPDAVIDFRYIGNRVPEGYQNTYRVHDYNFDNCLDIDLVHNATNPQSNGCDLDNDGLIDGIDVNRDGDMNDLISIDEACAMYGGSSDLTDDEIRLALANVRPAVLVVIAEQCFSGGLVDDLSGPGRIIMAASEEETVSWGNRFIRNCLRSLSGVAYADSSATVSPVADKNNDGFIDMVELFSFASANDYGVTMEIPVYDDSGDSVYHWSPLPAGGDGEFGAGFALQRGYGFLNAPGSLVATSTSSQTVQLTWSDLSSDEEGFIVERQQGQGPFKIIGTTAANVNTWSDSGLTSGVSYSYRIQADKSAGSSHYSNTASATPAYQLPAPPSN